MRIDTSTPPIDLNGKIPKDSLQDSLQIQSENRQVVQAARAVNASNSLGQDELTFSLDPTSHRTIIKVVNRDTKEVVEQIPSEVVLRLAESLKTTE